MFPVEIIPLASGLTTFNKITIPEDFEHGRRYAFSINQDRDGPFSCSFCHLRDATSVISTQFFVGSWLTCGLLSNETKNDHHKLCVGWTGCFCRCDTRYDDYRGREYDRPRDYDRGDRDRDRGSYRWDRYDDRRH